MTTALRGCAVIGGRGESDPTITIIATSSVDVLILPALERLLPQFSLPAVLAGTALNFVLNYIVGNGVLLLAGVYPRIPGATADEMEVALLAVGRNNPGLVVIASTLTALTMMVAGYVAGRIAKQDGGHNGAASAYIFTLLGAYAIVNGTFFGPPWLAVLSLLLTVILAAVGGVLGERSARRA